MDIKFPDKISRAQALIMLWNHTNPQGMGYMHSHQAPSLDDAEKLLSDNPRVDYFRGKPIKTNFKNYPILYSGGYDRDAGRGRMQQVVNNNAKFIGSSPELTETQKSQLIKACESSVSLSIGLAKDTEKITSENLPRIIEEKGFLENQPLDFQFLTVLKIRPDLKSTDNVYQMLPDRTLILCYLIDNNGNYINKEGSKVDKKEISLARVMDQRIFYSGILYAVEILEKDSNASSGIRIFSTRASDIVYPKI